jgi:vancomycin resistance protein YoaR
MEQQPAYYVNPPQSRRDEEGFNPWVLRLVLLGFAGMILLGFSLVALLAGYQFMTQDQIYAGVSPIYGVDVAGMTRQEAVIALSEKPSYADSAEFTFQYGDQQWTFSGAELGIEFDVDSTVNNAFAVGRSSSWAENMVDRWEIWRGGQPVSPVITYNRTQSETQLTQLSQNYINQAVLDATLTFQNGQVSTTPSQAGLSVDIPATLAVLDQEILAMNDRSLIQLVVTEDQPAIADTSEAAAKLEQALDERGVTFFIPAESGSDAGPWIAQPESIENMLRIERVENEDGTAYYDVSVTLDQAREFLTKLYDELSRDASNARFIFNDETKQLEVIESSVNGRTLDIDATVARFPTAVFNIEDRTVPLVFAEVIPTVNNNAIAEELGITELVSEATTYFAGSTASRRANIQVASSRFHGLVIAPGEEFSFNKYLGDVAPETGFEQAMIIVGGQTIEGVGGGVCQVSSTAFQAAFYAGFPILERYAHGYRVGYYETGEGAGMDAAVYSPIIDFRFQNDTPYHLLIETYMRPGSSELTFKFYSTSMGRRVVKEGPVFKNETPSPPAIYRSDPNLQAGEVVQTDYAVAGVEVFIYRTIYEGDEIIKDQEQFYSNYVPWPSQYNVAPGDARLGSTGG